MALLLNSWNFSISTNFNSCQNTQNNWTRGNPPKLLLCEDHPYHMICKCNVPKTQNRFQVIMEHVAKLDPIIKISYKKNRVFLEVALWDLVQKEFTTRWTPWSHTGAWTCTSTLRRFWGLPRPSRACTSEKRPSTWKTPHWWSPVLQFRSALGLAAVLSCCAQAMKWGWTQGQWPQKSGECLLYLLKKAESNGELKSLDVHSLVIENIQMNKAPKMGHCTYRPTTISTWTWAPTPHRDDPLGEAADCP